MFKNVMNRIKEWSCRKGKSIETLERRVLEEVECNCCGKSFKKLYSDTEKICSTCKAEF